MLRRLLRCLACLPFALSGAPLEASAQAPPAPVPAPSQEEATSFSAEQLDALLAPVALYPDTLLTQLLMASTFPLQIVDAARWVQDPTHKGLTGGQLEQALQPLAWNPSVKSLVPFPQVLLMMNDKLDWMQQLGFAFATQQADVLASVQRLRHQAQRAGNLKSTEQQVVSASSDSQAITIAPADPQVVYVPTYNPATTYGAWPYPAYPPVYVPPPPGYAFGTALATGLAFGAGVAIVGGLWNLGSTNWGRGDVNVNVNRYNNINTNRGQISSATWRAPAQRPGGGGAARPPGGPVGRPAGRGGLPANAVGRANVQVPGGLVNRPLPPGGAQGGLGGAARPGPGGQGPQRQAQGARTGQASRANQPARQPSASRQAAPAFSGMSDGRQAQQFSNRGAQSRQGQMQRSAPRPQASAARGGGGGRGGGAPRGGGGGRGGGRR
ncbi:DUF3300 domain-containing protein [Limobrevibacterium gyesilva]|uniref:DUF3300 domain-containing protein n=1 Tax=Limobrevibacterium gyesilva TaxID=2991712 RepID=A0AA42CDR5_9PROT|nr:DUF3300 domain-containing protein [Limobrevibacterium gyesilva]MCW3475188.1 DUF3300 domain-containing protein [Limobrevibacterium gyesilva]